MTGVEYAPVPREVLERRVQVRRRLGIEDVEPDPATHNLAAEGVELDGGPVDVSTGLPFVEKHPDIIDKFLRGICEGIAYFKTHRAESIKIIKEKYNEEGDLDDEAATYLYDELKMILQAKPYASLPAISNVYEISKEQDNAAEKTDPMALWDFHFLRRIDDSGFIDNLYRT